jgi:hypothetical protein
VVPAIWIPQAAIGTLDDMTAETIDSSTHRLDLVAHLDTCRPCASLFAFARERHDLALLAAWRFQLAAHLATHRERRDFDRDILSRLGVLPGSARERGGVMVRRFGVVRRGCGIAIFTVIIERVRAILRAS